MKTDTTEFALLQTYFALRPFAATGSLKELSGIVTASDGEITYLDDSHFGPGECFEEAASGYEGEGWYYKIRNIDDEFSKAESLFDAVREVASHDTSLCFLGTSEEARKWVTENKAVTGSSALAREIG